MEKIGEIIKNARELKKLSIKDVSKDTNITSRYLEAIEDEEFERIPGETYVIGFLRTYAEYLKLDADEIIQCYKGYKIGESATPLEELTKPTGPLTITSITNFFNQYRNLFYLSGGILFVIIIIWLFSALFSSNIDIEENISVTTIKNEYTGKENIKQNENIRNLKLTDDKGFVLLYKNETVQFLVDGKELMFMLKDVKGNSVILEFLPGNQYETIELEKPGILNINGSPREITLTLKGLTENRAKIFVMLGKKIGVDAEKVKETKDIDDSYAKGNVIAQNKKNLKIIFEADFISKTYLELYLDGMQKKKGLIPAGVKERWEASEYIQLKIGNAGGLKAVINGKAYTFGSPGQVANKVITWKKDIKNPNLYFIVVKDW